MQLFYVFALAITTVGAANLDFAAEIGFLEGRIINGHSARKGEAPYIVSLKKILHFCAGTIIHKNWVLTVAHCFKHNHFQVIAGMFLQTDLSDVQIRNVEGSKYLIKHNKYVSTGLSYDIGLIYIKEPFDFNDTPTSGSALVSMINLPSGPITQSGPGKVYGWGLVNSLKYPRKLQTLDVTIFYAEQCNAIMNFVKKPLHPFTLCTYKRGTSDGTCTGDSGGPLVHITSAGLELAGVVAHSSRPCVGRDKPTLYTGVYGFSEWIKNTMENYKVDDVAS